MRRWTQLYLQIVLTLTLVVSGHALAQQSEAVKQCLDCHQQSAEQPIHAIFQNAHGNLNGGGSQACIGCHGESLDHRTQPTAQAPLVSFGPKWFNSAEQQSETCLDCHQKHTGSLWQGSMHQQEEVACVGCHSAHVVEDPMVSATTQADTCMSCHSDVRSANMLASRHPIAEGMVACSDCHNPHGSLSESSLTQPTLNDTCFQCHAEKRGPFVFEHAPVTEDCSTCHNPHGSMHDNMLVSKTPFLCQQCHSAAFHPSQPLEGSGLPAGNSSAYLLSKNCLSCHSQIHGSSHPSGSKMTR
ncbi:DmsE family decaheme c-type cytochrome [Neiella sp. HB171785]|uniref:DmsE family decaheme c-type cytochrome n=1 Tax=Neiella litorisoli TaxID=2771431 RepID=A0A8J6QLB9_9GAMM|nr:DmsE family decaheme c-type cytochrome [Neiella litorisoli]MBD1390267.1 DmsE family decaheme c-type cytochrome [Neiella litorisoli]